AELGVVVLVAAGAVVGDLGQVEVGGGLPERGGLLELALPGGGGELGIEGLEQGAGGAADAGAVGHEAVGDPAAVGPLAAERRIEQESAFQPLHGGAGGTVRGDPRGRSTDK